MSNSVPARPPRYDLVGPAHDYPTWTGCPQRTILICSHQRSGSTMLGEALYFAGGLGCPLEYFHSGFRPGFEVRWGTTGMRALAHEVWHRRTDPNGTLSVKLFWSDIADITEQLTPGTFPSFRTVPADQIAPETYRALHDFLNGLFPNSVHIHLERRDRLRQAVSWFTAIQTDTWRRIPHVEGMTPAPVVEYDFDKINGLIVISLFCHAHWRAYFAAIGIEPYRIDYEDLATDYAHTIERLLSALGSTARTPTMRMERQSTAHSENLMRRFLRDQIVARKT